MRGWRQKNCLQLLISWLFVLEKPSHRIPCQLSFDKVFDTVIQISCANKPKQSGGCGLVWLCCVGWPCSCRVARTYFVGKSITKSKIIFSFWLCSPVYAFSKRSHEIMLRNNRDEFTFFPFSSPSFFHSLDYLTQGSERLFISLIENKNSCFACESHVVCLL